MSVAQGYEKVPTNGLVFMYDVADTTSYKGEPTTNLINPDAPNIYSWWGRNVQTITQLSETYKGQPIYRVSLSIDSGDMLYHINARWGAGSGWYMPYVTYYANTPYMASVIYRPVSHTDTRVYGHPSNISGWGANIDDSIDLDNGWKHHKIDRNYGTTVGDNRFYHMHTPSAQIGQTVTVDITNSQIEAKSYSTPFVNGTRSATQALFPLVGNNTFDLSNVSFNSNGQITFDGTNDYIIPDLTGISFGNEITIDIINNSDEIRNSSVIAGGEFGNQDLNIHLPWGDGNVYWDAGRPFNRVYKYAGNAALGLHHWVFTKNAVTGIMNIYLDGVLWAQNTGQTSTIVPIGISRIGMYTQGSYFGYYHKGTVPVVKIYNREFTQEEVQQSYNKYKTRFNLS